MPFLDRLEELRWRVLWSVLAIFVGTLAAYGLFSLVDILGFIIAPIEPYIPDGKLAFSSPAEPFVIILKVSVALGTVLASPVLAWQIWAFLAPALHKHEKRVIVPTFALGALLFIGGATVAYEFVLPKALLLLSGVQPEYFTPVVTAPAYFGFALRFIFGFGFITELPLVMSILAAFGVVTSRVLRQYRPYALLAAAVLAAFLTPPDAFSMVLMLLPTMFLYETSIWAAWLIERRRRAKQRS